MQLPAQKQMVEDNILFTNNLAGKWEIPALVLTSASYLGGNQVKLVLHMTKRNSVACHITSNLYFDKEGCVIQIEWTKAICDNYQSML